MTDQTNRLALPLLAAGQAQKEVFHNEALTALDTLVQPVVQGFAINTPPTSPTPGQSWIVGASPSGAWAGHADALATWTEGGWRFVAAFDGLTAWVASAGLWAQRTGGSWSIGILSGSAVKIGGMQVVGARGAAIADPGGGATVDTPARTAIAAVLVALRTHGLIAV